MWYQINSNTIPGLATSDFRNITYPLLDDFLNWKMEIGAFSYKVAIMIIESSPSNSAHGRD